MPWDILPKLVLSVRLISKRPRDGIGVQPVSYTSTLSSLLLYLPFSGLSGLAHRSTNRDTTAQNFGKARERLEELRKGGPKMQKSRVSRSALRKSTEGECTVM